MKYKISVIIPVFNGEKYLERSLNSLINQTIGFENLEIIMVDDVSTDSSRDIMNNYSNKFSNIKSFFSKENHGYPGFGRNVGIKNSQGKYIMFMDNDDEYSLDYCEVMFNKIEREQVDIVSSNFYIQKESKRINRNLFESASKYHQIYEKDIILNLKGYVPIFGSEIWNRIFKSSIIKDNDIKFIERGFNEDRLFIFNYCYYAKNIMYIDYYGYVWYRDGENLSYYSVKSTLGYINSYYEFCDVLKEKYPDVNFSEFFKSGIHSSIIRIIFSSDDKKDQLVLLEKLYEFEKYINFDGNIHIFWTNLFNKLILKKKFSTVLFLMKILRIGKKVFDIFN